MSRKVKKWLNSYPIVGRLVKMDVFIPALFSYMEVGDVQESRKMVKTLS